MYKILSYFFVFSVITSFYSCDTNSDIEEPQPNHSFRMSEGKNKLDIASYDAFVTKNDQVIITAYSPKLSEGENTDLDKTSYFKTNFIFALTSTETGEHRMTLHPTKNVFDAQFFIDSLYYTGDNQLYKNTRFTPELDSLDALNSFVFIDEFDNEQETLSGILKVRGVRVVSGVISTQFIYEGEFKDIPFSRQE
ncbi:MAG: hypothetical protein N4A45_10630 [Flavobacteriales bacterium]|jgi:hypothetical protein|nr:hypothetical protein [Flavobacteriales bacterium]